MLIYRCHMCAPSREFTDLGLALCHMIDEHRMLTDEAKKYLSLHQIDTSDPEVDTIGQE